MWALVVIGILAAAYAVFQLRLIPPLNSSTVIQIRRDGLKVTKGSVRAEARTHVSEILHEAGVSRGFIAMTAGNRVIFSPGIPASVHQRIRNVLLNQWP